MLGQTLGVAWASICVIQFLHTASCTSLYLERHAQRTCACSWTLGIVKNLHMLLARRLGAPRDASRLTSSTQYSWARPVANHAPKIRKTNGIAVRRMRLASSTYRKFKRIRVLVLKSTPLITMEVQKLRVLLGGTLIGTSGWSSNAHTCVVTSSFCARTVSG